MIDNEFQITFYEPKEYCSKKSLLTIEEYNDNINYLTSKTSSNPIGLADKELGVLNFYLRKTSIKKVHYGRKQRRIYTRTAIRSVVSP